MREYDLTVLNDKEFEVLVADLLAAEIGAPVERFKPGRDAGVDARWFTSPGSEVIVQCKHWPRSNVAAIVRKISSEEKAKVIALDPSRYIFVCSLPLSRKNKDAISGAFMPYVVSPDDVLGYEDLQRLISTHKAVERKHYKLWLASSNVLVTLLNHSVLGRSADSVDDIRHALAKFVETEDCRRARKQLANARVLIIKGEPGVGKTTLAQHLVMESIGDGYQFVEIQSDLSEAEGVLLDPEEKQIFYFDDFLGRNFLEVFTDNKDSHVLAFIRRVLRNENKRFVLTSRTHILDRGKQLSEFFRIENIGKREFELTVGALSRLEKGMILYSHIWNTGLPEWAIEALYEEQRYLDVIDHANFNPRLIAFITDPERIAEVAPHEFWTYVTATLENPEAIWRHVFERQLSPDTRDLAVLVAFNGKPINETDLEAAFARLNQSGTDNPVQFAVRFRDALRLSAGSVITRTVASSADAKCELFNPSIADFLLKDEALLSRAPEIARALQTVDSVNYLASLTEAGYLSAGRVAEAIRSIAADVTAQGDVGGDLSVRIADLFAKGAEANADAAFVGLVANSFDLGSICKSAARVRIFAAALTAGAVQDSARRFEGILEEIEACPLEAELLRPLRRCALWLEENGAGGAELRLREALVTAVFEYAQEFIVESTALDEYMYEGDASLARQDARICIEKFFEELGFPLAEEEVEDFVSRIDVVDIINDNVSAASDRWDDSDSGGRAVNGDDAIVDYFDRSGQE
ncbi:MAG: restriction endonuclease [Halothiobacillus sp.]|jgi:DNA polymerase III delta prime subunit|nr:restriction endonuclease [Halothiobacillus sp.]